MIELGYFLKTEKEPEGEIVIGMRGLGFLSWLTPYIAAYSKKYPKVKLQICAQDIDFNIFLREVDVRISFDVEAHEEVLESPIREVWQNIYASPKYIENFGQPNTIDDLDVHDLITYGGRTINDRKYLDWLLTVGREKKYPRKAKLEVNSPESLIYFCQQGLGITALSNLTYERYKPKLVKILPEMASQKRWANCTCLRKNLQSPAISSFVGFIEKNIKK